MKRLIFTTLLLALLLPAGRTAAEIYGTYLKGWYRMDNNDISGTALTDRSGSGINGTLSGSPTTNMVGKKGQTINFDGIDDFINLGTTHDYAAVTYSAWVKADTFTNAYESIVDRQTAGFTIYTELFITSAGKLATYVKTVSGGAFYDGTGTYTLTAGKWYHIAITYSTTDGLKGYVNGALDGSAIAAGDITTGTSASTYIGKSPSTASREFDGLIDDVRIYNGALNGYEIAQLYNAGRTHH